MFFYATKNLRKDLSKHQSKHQKIHLSKHKSLHMLHTHHKHQKTHHTLHSKKSHIKKDFVPYTPPTDVVKNELKLHSQQMWYLGMESFIILMRKVFLMEQDIHTAPGRKLRRNDS